MRQLGLYRKNAKDTTLKIAEVDVQNYALSRLSIIGNVWRNNSGMVHGRRYDGSEMHIKLAPKGSADIIGYHRRNGRFIAIECKSKIGVTDLIQDYFLEEVRHAGGYGFVVHSTEEVDIVAKQLEKEGM